MQRSRAWTFFVHQPAATRPSSLPWSCSCPSRYATPLNSPSHSPQLSPQLQPVLLGSTGIDRIGRDPGHSRAVFTVLPSGAVVACSGSVQRGVWRLRLVSQNTLILRSVRWLTAFGLLMIAVPTVNVAAILMDLSLVILEYLGFYFAQIILKAAVYSIKLKMEFAVLGMLVSIVHSHASDRPFWQAGCPRRVFPSASTEGGPCFERRALPLPDQNNPASCFQGRQLLTILSTHSPTATLLDYLSSFDLSHPFSATWGGLSTGSGRSRRPILG